MCSAEGCGRKTYCKKLCNMHWQRVRRNGSLVPKHIRGNDIARFWSKVKKTKTCWLWAGSVNQEGYGVFGAGYKTILAHRYSYELVGHTLTPSVQLDHVRNKGCENRNCVNPLHLEITTQRENVIRGLVHLERKHKLPVGVTISGRKYVARKSFNGKEFRIGVFDTPSAASMAYVNAEECQYV